MMRLRDDHPILFSAHSYKILQSHLKWRCGGLEERILIDMLRWVGSWEVVGVRIIAENLATQDCEWRAECEALLPAAFNSHSATPIVSATSYFTPH
ncbi:UNVERIFIED_CONTAM: hypothetical protein Sindi_0586000 [Sesamum indicum]